MPREGEDRLVPQGIPDGLDNKQGGGVVAHARYCPRWRNRLGVVGRTPVVEVDNMGMASIPLVGGTVVE